MAHEGQELEGPNGYRMRFVQITEDLLAMDAHYAGRGDLPPAHFHPRQVEHFTVLEGEVRAVIDGEDRRFGAGQDFDVPAGTVHQLAGDGPARLKWEVRPALNMADFFEELYSGAANTDFNDFLERYADEFQLAEEPGF
ncbi:MAG TPA: cupin domain-containing protein [Solirubrobacteraceae bacterium]|nr:cupin domain-containing protein [Solirubrobacteraceae bacterium]